MDFHSCLYVYTHTYHAAVGYMMLYVPLFFEMLYTQPIPIFVA